MIGNSCLLDTSIIIHAFRKHNEVSDKLDTIDEVYVPVTVAGELFFGAYKSADPVKHISQITMFPDNCKMLQTDIETSEIYGSVKASLANTGNPIPENDIWIAAIALQYNLPLYTTDAHFNKIDGLKLLKSFSGK